MKLTLRDLRPMVAALMTLGVLAVMVPSWPAQADTPLENPAERDILAKWYCDGVVTCKLADDEDKARSCTYMREAFDTTKGADDAARKARNKWIPDCRNRASGTWNCKMTSGPVCDLGENKQSAAPLDDAKRKWQCNGAVDVRNKEGERFGCPFENTQDTQGGKAHAERSSKLDGIDYCRGLFPSFEVVKDSAWAHCD